MSSAAPETLIWIIIFAVGALILLSITWRFIPGLQGSFESSICKFSSFIRTNTIGLPSVQFLLSLSQSLVGGIGGTNQLVTSLSRTPITCKQAPPISPGDGNYFHIKDVIKKISDEVVNCWDQFGLGKWDPLILSSEGQSYICFDQTMNIKCTPDELSKLWDPITTEVTDKLEFSNYTVDSSVLTEYLATHYFGYSGLNALYASVLPQNMPLVGGRIDCSLSPAAEHNYQVVVYFIDSFTTFQGVSAVPTICGAVDMLSQKSDKVQLCLTEI